MNHLTGAALTSTHNLCLDHKKEKCYYFSSQENAIHRGMKANNKILSVLY